jgi:ubiquinone/menaquinone biosynthesis C-methylase UbiE
MEPVVDDGSRVTISVLAKVKPRQVLVTLVVRARLSPPALLPPWEDPRVDSVDVKAFFERVSGEWDSMRSSFYNERVIDALAQRAGADATCRVVDVGTGTGFVAAGLAPRVASVIGVDNSPAMLAVARRNLRALDVGNVQLLEGELDALPLEDDSMDAAVGNMVLHHAPDPAAMLTEMARVVRPGGVVAVTDEVEHEYEWMRTEQADLWLGFSQPQVEGFFASARLVAYGYDTLGMQ